MAVGIFVRMGPRYALGLAGAFAGFLVGDRLGGIVGDRLLGRWFQ